MFTYHYISYFEYIYDLYSIFLLFSNIVFSKHININMSCIPVFDVLDTRMEMISGNLLNLQNNTLFNSNQFKYFHDIMQLQDGQDT